MDEYRGGVIRVLLVDDDPSLAAAATDYLEEDRDDVSVVTADSARAGIRKLDDSIDCIVGDHDMPGRDGLQFLRAVGTEYPDLPFVLLVDGDDRQTAIDALDAGASDVVRKDGGVVPLEILANRNTTLVWKRRAATAPAEIDERLVALFDRVTDAVVELDDDWRVTHLNGAAEDLFCVDAADLQGSVLWVAFPDAIGTRFQERLEAAAGRDRPITFEEFYSPLFTWLEVRVYPGGDGVSLSLRELDDVLSTAGDPRALDRTFRAVFEATDDAMLFVDEEGTCTDANGAAAALPGYRRRDVGGGAGRAVRRRPGGVRCRLDGHRGWRPVVGNGYADDGRHRCFGRVRGGRDRPGWFLGVLRPA
ncbi:MAG: response regulator [Halobacteriales archaeon]